MFDTSIESPGESANNDRKLTPCPMTHCAPNCCENFASCAADPGWSVCASLRIYFERSCFLRKITLAAVALAGSMALIGVTAVPAFAAPTGDTPVTVTVAAGVLAITVP